MKMCEEMVKLREELDKRGIEWEDKSFIVSEEAIEDAARKGIGRKVADCSIYRTHFQVGEYFYSVIYGYGTYGGVDPCFAVDLELLECMTEKTNGGEPVGWLTAEDVMAIVDGD